MVLQPGWLAGRYIPDNADNGRERVHTKDARLGRPVDTAPGATRNRVRAYFNSCRAMIVRWISEAPS